MAYRIPLIKSTFYRENIIKQDLINFLRKAKKLSLDKYVTLFEQKFAKWQKRKFAVMFNSGSSANLALLQSLKNLGYLKNKEKVGFSSVTWSTNVMPIIQLGFVPIPIDVEVKTLNVSFKAVSEFYKKYDFKALFLTNLLGFAGDLDKIKEFCEDKKILLLEDNCESLGSEYLGVKLGNFSFASTFSFYVGHHLSTIEGGMVCTDNKHLYQMLKIVRAHGFARDLEQPERKRLKSKFKISNFYEMYTFYDLGYNLRPTEINGFLGCKQMSFVEEIITKREKNFIFLSQIYRLSDSLLNIKPEKMTRISNFGFPIIASNKQLANRLIRFLQRNRVEVRPLVGGNITKQPFYKKYFRTNFSLPNAEYLHERGFYFGNNPELTEDDLNYILFLFKRFFE